MAKILSVEDDPDAQHLIGQILFKEGHDMTYAWNGEEGYEKIMSNRPDLILLDLMLPIMNGVELLDKLRLNKATCDIPVIVASSFGDEANLLGTSVRALGAFDYLRKPIQVPELVRAVRLALAQIPKKDNRRANRELRKGKLRAQPASFTVMLGNQVFATLPSTEFKLVAALMEKDGPVSREKLLAAMGYSTRQKDALKQAVHRLRASFGPKERHRLRTTSEGYELIG